MTLDDLSSVELDTLQKSVHRAARSVAFQWPGILEEDDAEQEIMMKLLQSPSGVQKVLKSDSALRHRLLTRMGHQAASRERADFSHFSGNYRYSVGETKDILNRGALVQAVDRFDEAVFDLVEALEALTARSPQYVHAITSRYADEVVPQDSQGKNALSNGLTALTDEMNKSNNRRHATFDDGPGSRSVVSNATARHSADMTLDGTLHGWT